MDDSGKIAVSLAIQTFWLLASPYFPNAGAVPWLTSWGNIDMYGVTLRVPYLVCVFHCLGLKTLLWNFLNKANRPRLPTWVFYIAIQEQHTHKQFRRAINQAFIQYTVGYYWLNRPGKQCFKVSLIGQWWEPEHSSHLLGHSGPSWDPLLIYFIFYFSIESTLSLPCVWKVWYKYRSRLYKALHGVESLLIITVSFINYLMNHFLMISLIIYQWVRITKKEN